MLGAIRKFSTSIYAKVLMGIVIIPFIFWGMGSNFFGGNRNVIVTIEKEKFTIQNFVDYINEVSPDSNKVNSNQIEGFLSAFIGEQLIEKEINYFEIELSDKSLSKLIKHQKDFERNNKFSRIEYEKFLLKNNLTAVDFELIFLKQEKKKQFFEFIGGGILPSKYLVNQTYNRINQKRNIEIINLNDAFNKKIVISEDKIKSFYENNKNKYKEIYKSINLIELNPKNLSDSNEFNDIFFKKVDEIDYMIIEGKSLNDIIQKYGLKKPTALTLNRFGKDLDLNKITNLPENIIENIFVENISESIFLLENIDKYFIVEMTKTEEVQRKIENKSVRKNIISILQNAEKRKLVSKIIVEINKNNFIKSDFDKLSNEENVEIKKIVLKNQNDNMILKSEIVNEIYTYPEKKVVVIHDLNFAENLLVFIDKIENIAINENSSEYQKYLKMAKTQITASLYNTYDNYIKKRYKIDINYQAVDTVKNYFN